MRAPGRALGTHACIGMHARSKACAFLGMRTLGVPSPRRHMLLNTHSLAPRRAFLGVAPSALSQMCACSTLISADCSIFLIAYTTHIFDVKSHSIFLIFEFENPSLIRKLIVPNSFTNDSNCNVGNTQRII